MLVKQIQSKGHVGDDVRSGKWQFSIFSHGTGFILLVEYYCLCTKVKSYCQRF
jgi:hypothetical protein